jgi:hypothetical protein
MKFFVIITICLISISTFAFLYPVKRHIRTEVDITKFRYCDHDCYTHGLNQRDAHRCLNLCHYE